MSYEKNKNSKNNSAKGGRRGNWKNASRKDNPSKAEGHTADTPFNDWKWYAANEVLLRDSASLSTFNPLGTRLGARGGASNTFSAVFDTARVPGILRCDYVPTVGSTDAPSALSQASRAIYSYVRHANSGSKNYENTDLMMYLLAMDSAMAWWTTLTRLYGTMMTYSSVNRYYARALVMAQGFDYDSLITQLPDLRLFINRLALNLAKLAVPSDFTYYQRHVALSSNLFLDAPSTKAQIFFWRQVQYWKFSGRTSETGTELLSVSPALQLATLDDIADFSAELVTPLMIDEDVGIMSGDIMKAYDKGKLLQFAFIDENYVVHALYDDIANMQLQNATFASVEDVADVHATIQQENGALVAHVYFDGSVADSVEGTLPLVDRILNFEKDDPTPADVMEATRFTWIPSSVVPMSEGTFRYTVKDIGSELMLAPTAVYFAEADGEVDVVESPIYPQFISSAPQWLNLLSVFKHHPIVYGGAVSSTYANWPFIGNLNNYTVVDDVFLTRIHQAAVTNMFDVPEVMLIK